MGGDVSLSQGFLTGHMLRVAAPSPMNYSPAWDTGMWTLCPHRCCPLMSETSLPHLITRSRHVPLDVANGKQVWWASAGY